MYIVHKSSRLSKARYLTIDNRAMKKQNCSLKKSLLSTSLFCNSSNALLLWNCFLILTLFYFCLSMQSSIGFSSFLLFFYTVVPLICFSFLPTVNFMYFSCLLSSFYVYLFFILLFEFLFSVLNSSSSPTDL